MSSENECVVPPLASAGVSVLSRDRRQHDATLVQTDNRAVEALTDADRVFIRYLARELVSMAMMDAAPPASTKVQ
jgi:hypothetical protein